MRALRTNPLKLKHDALLSTVAFDFNLRRYNEEAAAVGAIIAALLAHRGAAMAGEQGEDLARAICRVAVAVSERDVTVLVRGDADGLALTELVLELAEAHERPVMEAAADYFLMLNTVPVADRAPQLGEPLFRRLVAAVLRRATLPAGGLFRTSTRPTFNLLLLLLASV